MRKTPGRIAYLALVLLWSSSVTWGQEWEKFQFNYKKWEPDLYKDFQGSIKYGLYYERAGGERIWITRYGAPAAGREGNLIDFSAPPGKGKLVLTLKDLVWGEESHNDYGNFIVLRTDEEIVFTEGFAIPHGKRSIVRNPDQPSATLSFPFDPALISRQEDGTVYGRLAINLLVHVDGKDLSKKLLDFEYKLKFSPREGWEARPDTFFSRSVEEEMVAPATENAVSALPAPVPVPVPESVDGQAQASRGVPAEIVETAAVGAGVFSLTAVPANDERGEVAISIRHDEARSVGEFMLYFQKRLFPGARWWEVPYQNYNMERLDELQSGGEGAFRIIYRDFGPGEYQVLATRGEERDSVTFRIDPGSQPPSALFTQQGQLVHLRVRGGQPPFRLQYRPEGDTAWSTVLLSERLYDDPLLTYFENLQDKVDAFQKNGTYDIRILSRSGVPVVERASLVIDRPWSGWQTLGWAGGTLLLVGLFFYLRHLWWKRRTFYE